MSRIRRKPAAAPLTRADLETLALGYAARYATSRARLGAYLTRKLKERGWADAQPPDTEALVERLARNRYVDDGAFAAMRGGALTRRGYGPRRVAEALRAAGIEEAERSAAVTEARQEAWRAAEHLARRKRIGPFAAAPADPDQRRRQLAAFLRAGHDMAVARAWIDARPGELPDDPDRS